MKITSPTVTPTEIQLEILSLHLFEIPSFHHSKIFSVILTKIIKYLIFLPLGSIQRLIKIYLDFDQRFILFYFS